MSEELWDRQPGEPSKAYAALSFWLGLGLERSIVRAVKLIVGESATVRQIAARKRQFEKWSSRYAWVERARAYDAEQARQERLEQEKGIRSMKERHIDMAVMAQNLIAQRLQQIQPEDLAPRLLMDWFKVAVDLERKSRGLPDKIEVTGEGGGAIPVQLTLQETLEQICVFYNLDPKLARPQRERLSIGAGNPSDDGKPADEDLGSAGDSRR